MKNLMKSIKSHFIIIAVFVCLCLQGCCTVFTTEQPTDSMPISGSFICKVGPAGEAGGRSYINYEPGYGFSDLMNASRIELIVDKEVLEKENGEVSCTVELENMEWGTDETDTYANLRVTYSGLEYGTKYKLCVHGYFVAYNGDVCVATSQNLKDIFDNMTELQEGDVFVWLKTISSGSGNPPAGNTSNGSSSSNKEEIHNSESVHEHSYSWVTVQEAGVGQDGMEEYKCSCGDVKERNVIPATQAYVNELMDSIDQAPANGTNVLDTGRFYTMSDAIVRKLAERSDITVEITFEYDRKSYKMVIPAGADYAALLDDEENFYGYFYFAKVIGASIEEIMT